MAALLHKTAGDLAELKEFDRYIACEGLWQMLMDSVAGFANGRLPGNLGDTPEALKTGAD